MVREIVLNAPLSNDPDFSMFTYVVTDGGIQIGTPTLTETEEKVKKHYQYLDIVCTHKFGACSTALLKGFIETYPHTEKGKLTEYFPITYELFVKNLRTCMGRTIESLSNNRVTSYAFILASTQRKQIHRKWFKDFGFDETEEVFNTKNHTSVMLHIMSVPKVLAKLKELENGT